MPLAIAKVLSDHCTRLEATTSQAPPAARVQGTRDAALADLYHAGQRRYHQYAQVCTKKPPETKTHDARTRRVATPHSRDARPRAKGQGAKGMAKAQGHTRPRTVPCTSTRGARRDEGQASARVTGARRVNRDPCERDHVHSTQVFRRQKLSAKAKVIHKSNSNRGVYHVTRPRTF